MKLVADWQEAHRWISIRLSALGVALPPAWLAMPDDWRAAVPRWAILAFTFLSLSVIAGRMVDQKPADQK